MTIHGIIASNALNFIYKIRHFPSNLPKSIRITIAENLTCKIKNGYLKYVFYEGPLIATKTIPRLANLVTPVSLLNVKIFKANMYA